MFVKARDEKRKKAVLLKNVGSILTEIPTLGAGTRKQVTLFQRFHPLQIPTQASFKLRKITSSIPLHRSPRTN